MNRLQGQLILAFTLVVLVAVGSIALLINQTTDTAFRRYVTNSGLRGSGAGVQVLVDYYQEQGNWDGIEELLGQGVILSGPGDEGMPSMNRRPGWPARRLDAILADAGGKIVYDSAGEAQGRRLSSREKAQALTISETEGGEVLGYLLLSVPGGMDPLGQLERRFLENMRTILITGGLLAVVLGVILGVILSRSLTAPLQRLASAARAVAAGDLDQQVQVEGSAEMADLAQAFNEMTEALGASERQRQNMVADVAHELRTPLSVIQGNLRAILDDVYDLDKGEISRLYDESRLLGRLVDDLRELALADAGQLRLHMRPTDIGQVVRSTVESLSPAAESQGLSLSAQVPSALPAVLADSDRVAQVLRNLLVNALRHTPAGGSVTVVVSQQQGTVETAVLDTGVGISQEDLPYVFDRFWRGDPARVRSGSTGLGLSVAQSLVEAQGGRIWAESTLGQGSAFRFALPIAA
jgi:two-component system OmpR family sensor kinase/two-component system sensor histidine kinase BaeS